MFGVIETDAEDILARSRDRREQGHIPLWQRGADQISSGRCADGFLEEAQSDRAQVDELEHRRWQVVSDRIAEIFDVDHQPVVEQAEPRFGFDRAIGHKAHG